MPSKNRECNLLRHTSVSSNPGIPRNPCNAGALQSQPGMLSPIDAPRFYYLVKPLLVCSSPPIWWKTLFVAQLAQAATFAFKGARRLGPGTTGSVARVPRAPAVGAVIRSCTCPRPFACHPEEAWPCRCCRESASPRLPVRRGGRTAPGTRCGSGSGRGSGCLVLPLSDGSTPHSTAPPRRVEIGRTRAPEEPCRRRSPVMVSGPYPRAPRRTAPSVLPLPRGPGLLIMRVGRGSHLQPDQRGA